MAQRAVDTVLAEARAEIAAGRFPDVVALRARLAGDAEALAKLDAVMAVYRARQKLSDTVKLSDSRAALRTRPTVNANMDVRRSGSSTLVWDPAASVAGWEVRISERPDARADYAVRETHQLPSAATSVELPLAELPLRVHLLGRTRDGRLVRRAVISGLTRDSWNDRWQRRASAS
jgi:hypothetical protein